MKNIVTEVETAEAQAETTLAKVLAAVERWYAEHFHRAALAGVAPLSMTDKASLVTHVSSAIHPEDK